MSNNEASPREEYIPGVIPHEMYCTLCGIPFWSYMEFNGYTHKDEEDDRIWLSFFLGLRIPNGVGEGVNIGPYSEVCLTGIGQYDQQQPRVPPPGYDIRDIVKPLDIQPGGQSKLKIWFLMNSAQKEEWKMFEQWNKLRHVATFYFMHPRCWEILQQQYTLAAPPGKTVIDLRYLANIFTQIPLTESGGGFKPDWTTDYAGTEYFFGDDEETQSYESNIEEAPEWHFLLRDPSLVFGFDDLIANPPPLESAPNVAPRIQFVDNGSDIFSKLPSELLDEILVLLPSSSVRDLQLASRKMASMHLSPKYWRSRFEFPNELCHVKPPEAGRVEDRKVDWRCLCEKLLHPVGWGFDWWKNRKRIIELNRKLVQSMERRGSDGRFREVDN